MRKYYLIFLCLVLFTDSYGQIFLQDFSTGTALRSYVGTEKGQFTTISNFRNSPAKIENKQLIFTKKGESSSFFATQYAVSTATKLTFDIEVAPTDPMALNESHRGVFLIGGGSDKNWTVASPKQPLKENVHTRVMFNISYAGDNIPQYSFANSKTQFKGKTSITIISNNTGSPLKYK